MKTMLSLRPVEEKDCKLLWEWRNEKGVRESSFDQRYIPYEEHKKWFEKKIKSKNTKILIIQNSSGKNIGQVRFEIKSSKVAEISIIIDKSERRKGYGVKALKLSSEYAFKSLPIKEIIAYVKQENIPSLRTFEKSGFVVERPREIRGYTCYEMVLRKDNSKDKA